MSRAIVNRLRVRPRSALVALFAFCAAAVADGPTDSHSSKQYTRVVSGGIARTESWPWQVALIKPRTSRTLHDTGFQRSCSGTVIAPRWVLTAAHCVGDLDPGDLEVLAGTHDLDQGGWRIDVTAIRVHEDYTGVSGGSDIALLRLARAAGVAPVDVPTAERSEALATPGTLATMIGWGGLRALPCEQASGPGDNECEGRERGLLSGILVNVLTSYLVDIVSGHVVDALTDLPVPWSDVQSSKLMETELPLIGEQACRDAYPDATIDHRTLCAEMRQGRTYSCQGDSGGPLVVRDDDTWVQAGVVSWGVSCAKPGRYGVYTRVGAFADWIRAETDLSAVAGSGAAPQEMAWSVPADSIPAVASSLETASLQEPSTTAGLPAETSPETPSSQEPFTTAELPAETSPETPSSQEPFTTAGLPAETPSSDDSSGSALQSEVAAAAGEALGHGNAAGVRLQIRPSSRLRVGDAVTYRVESGRSGHLLIVDVAADGTVTQLFPNRFSERAGKETTIGAERSVEIPSAYDGFRLRASPPLGRGSLFAVVAEDPVALDDLLAPNRDLRPVANAKDWLLALGERLRKPLPEASGTRRAHWSMVRVEYEIVQ